MEKDLVEYNELFKDNKDASFTTHEDENNRQKGYKTMVSNFYNIVTDFYEWGWCDSFHFAPRSKADSFQRSIDRSEEYLSDKLKLKEGMRVIDCGCGVGGPMRHIAKYSK